MLPPDQDMKAIKYRNAAHGLKTSEEKPFPM